MCPDDDMSFGDGECSYNFGFGPAWEPVREKIDEKDCLIYAEVDGVLTDTTENELEKLKRKRSADIRKRNKARAVETAEWLSLGAMWETAVAGKKLDRRLIAQWRKLETSWQRVDEDWRECVDNVLDCGKAKQRDDEDSRRELLEERRDCVAELNADAEEEATDKNSAAEEMASAKKEARNRVAAERFVLEWRKKIVITNRSSIPGAKQMRFLGLVNYSGKVEEVFAWQDFIKQVRKMGGTAVVDFRMTYSRGGFVHLTGNVIVPAKKD